MLVCVQGSSGSQACENAHQRKANDCKRHAANHSQLRRHSAYNRKIGGCNGHIKHPSSCFLTLSLLLLKSAFMQGCWSSQACKEALYKNASGRQHPAVGHCAKHDLGGAHIHSGSPISYRWQQVSNLSLNLNCNTVFHLCTDCVGALEIVLIPKHNQVPACVLDCRTAY